MMVAQGGLLGIGANLPAARYGSAAATCQAAIRHWTPAGGDGDGGFAVVPLGAGAVRRSAVVRQCRGGGGDGRVGGVVADRIHAVEDQFGRFAISATRRRCWTSTSWIIAARLPTAGAGTMATPILPHPRMDVRAFVLLPLLV